MVTDLAADAARGETDLQMGFRGTSGSLRTRKALEAGVRSRRGFVRGQGVKTRKLRDCGKMKI